MPTHKTAHLQAPTHKPVLQLAKELFSCRRTANSAHHPTKISSKNYSITNKMTKFGKIWQLKLLCKQSELHLKTYERNATFF
jgi:hypothetical protein